MGHLSLSAYQSILRAKLCLEMQDEDRKTNPVILGTLSSLLESSSPREIFAPVIQRDESIELLQLLEVHHSHLHLKDHIFCLLASV